MNIKLIIVFIALIMDEKITMSFELYGSNLFVVQRQTQVGLNEIFRIEDEYRKMLISKTEKIYKTYAKKGFREFICLCSISSSQVQRAKKIVSIDLTKEGRKIVFSTGAYSENKEICIQRCICEGKYTLDWSKLLIQRLIFLFLDYKYRIISIQHSFQEINQLIDTETIKEEESNEENIGESNIKNESSKIKSDKPVMHTKKYAEESMKNRKEYKNLVEMVREKQILNKEDNKILNNALKNARKENKARIR